MAKRYWEMTSNELRNATKAFDDPSYQPPALPQTPEDRKQRRRARQKRIGKPSTSKKKN
jgi:hypothetical protein